MNNSRTASRLLVHAALFSLVAGAVHSSAIAETPEEAKAQADLTAAQLANAKSLQDLIAANKATTEGKATVEALEAGAEGLQLRHIVEHELAVQLANAIGEGNGNSLVLIFGKQPPTTAHYLSMLHGKEELRRNLELAIAMAKSVYGRPGPRPGPTGPRDRGPGAMVGGPAVALTAISTLVSLLKVDSEIKGVALASDADFLGPVIAQRLVAKRWNVRAPSNIATATPFATALVDELRPGRDKAAEYYAKYLDSLTAKGGKVEDLPANERIAGRALETVMGDYGTLVAGLFTPVEGVLPATVLEEEKALATAPNGQRVLFVQKHEAALTSITKKGFLTGIIGIPAFVSASTSASYAMVGGTQPTFGSVSYTTPVMRVTRVADWVPTAMTPLDQTVVGAGAGGGATSGQ